MKTSNKAAGNRFEQRVCQDLASKGFWVHNFADRRNGQPVDIIAAKNSLPSLVEAKYCRNEVFQTSRIEENQLMAIEHWFNCGNDGVLFAFGMPDEEIIYLLFCGMDEIKAFMEKKQWGREELRNSHFAMKDHEELEEEEWERCETE